MYLKQLHYKDKVITDLITMWHQILSDFIINNNIL